MTKLLMSAYMQVPFWGLFGPHAATADQVQCAASSDLDKCIAKACIQPAAHRWQGLLWSLIWSPDRSLHRSLHLGVHRSIHRSLHCHQQQRAAHHWRGLLWSLIWSPNWSLHRSLHLGVHWSIHQSMHCHQQQRQHIHHRPLTPLLVNLHTQTMSSHSSSSISRRSNMWNGPYSSFDQYWPSGLMIWKSGCNRSHTNWHTSQMRLTNANCMLQGWKWTKFGWFCVHVRSSLFGTCESFLGYLAPCTHTPVRKHFKLADIRGIWALAFVQWSMIVLKPGISPWARKKSRSSWVKWRSTTPSCKILSTKWQLCSRKEWGVTMTWWWPWHLLRIIWTF